jgi:hypothetical protein
MPARVDTRRVGLTTQSWVKRAAQPQRTRKIILNLYPKRPKNHQIICLKLLALQIRHLTKIRTLTLRWNKTKLRSIEMTASPSLIYSNSKLSNAGWTINIILKNVSIIMKLKKIEEEYWERILQTYVHMLSPRKLDMIANLAILAHGLITEWRNFTTRRSTK